MSQILEHNASEEVQVFDVLSNGAAHLSVENISWIEPQNRRTILHPISFVLEPGQVLGVVGPNGAGKSSLLRLLYRYQTPTTGTIKINGSNINQMTARNAARIVAAVLQEQPTDFGLTVRDIVALGRTPHVKGFGGKNGARDNQIITHTLEHLKLKEFSNRQIGTLSGGERQRVMLARALAQEPRLLVLDEPTNHLDIRNQLEVLKLIRELPLTIVCSLHDLNMAASVCDCVLLIKDGQPLGYGPSERVFSEKGVSRAFSVLTMQERLDPSNRKHFTFKLN